MLQKFFQWVKVPRNKIIFAISMALVLVLLLGWVYLASSYNASSNLTNTSSNPSSTPSLPSLPSATPSDSASASASSNSSSDPSSSNSNSNSTTTNNSSGSSDSSYSNNSNSSSSGSSGSSNSGSSYVPANPAPPQPAPSKPEKKGHWEKVWVSNWVTIPGKPAVTKKVYVCHVTRVGGKVYYEGHSTDECGNKALELTKQYEDLFSWGGQWKTVVVEPATPEKKVDQGHYENRWVED